MQFNKTFLTIAILVILAGVVGGTVGMRNGWFGTEAAAEDAAKEESQDKAFDSLEKKMGGKETPISVVAEPAYEGTLIQKVATQGRVFSYNQADIVNEVPGFLMKLHVKDGDRVKKGQVIAEIDDREYALAYQDARARELAAKADLVTANVDVEKLDLSKTVVTDAHKELERQYKEGLLSKTDYERQRYNLDLAAIRGGEARDQVLVSKYVTGAEVSRKQAELNLEKTKIIAPFDGEVFGVSTSVGVRLAGNTMICRLVGTSDLVIKAQVLESEVGAVSVGRSAVMRFTALPDLGWVNGKVTAVSPFVNETEKTVETIVEVDSNDTRIRPGMFAEVIIDAREFDGKLLVPKTAIIARDNRKVIFKVGDDSRAKWLYVKTGVENDELVEITEGGLQPGDMVLTDNHFTMGHDTLVKIKK